MLYRSLLFGCVLIQVSTLSFDEGCEVKQQWEVEPKWPRIRLSAWLTKNKTEVMEMKITFKDVEALTDNDSIFLTKRNFTFTATRQLRTENSHSNFSVLIQEGWVDFTMYINENYSIWYEGPQNKSLIIQKPLKFRPALLTVKGSNITLNCRSNLRLWHVSAHPTTIPFDNKRDQWLCFYSDSSIKPFIKLGTKEIPLRWDMKALTTLHDKKPLPAFKTHNITVSCNLSEITTCMIKQSNNGKSLEVIKLSQMPEVISVRGNSTFSVLLQEVDQELPESNNNVKVPTLEDNRQEDTRQGMRFVILSVVVCVIIVVVGLIGGILLVRKFSNVRREQNRTDECDGTEMAPMLPTPIQPPTTENDNESRTASTTADDSQLDQQRIKTNKIELMDAVVQDRPQKIKELLEDMKDDEEISWSACFEAHLLCRTEILHIFNSLQNSEREPIIHAVHEEYDRRVKMVFEAAYNGRYRQGVQMLLQKFELPATIRNIEGLSLLHVIASAKDMKERPLWTAENTRLFLKNSSCYANAIDFKGQTCLHYLANGASHLEDITVWDTLEMSVESAWIELAKLLLEFGCDPFIDDTEGQQAHECATERMNLKLAKCLTNYATKKGKVDEKKSDMIIFEALVKEARTGKAATMKDLMASNKHLLPMGASHNPLTVAITRGELEITLLLLSGGAYPCGLPRTSFTPLEAAHGVKSLPAIFPAIMRQECINRLKFERNSIQKEDELSCHIENLISQLRDGKVTDLNMKYEGKNHDEISKEARKLLCMAAKQGLTLTCQMFGLLNVNLQAYPEEYKPIKEAFQSRKDEIVYVLSRDLQVSVFTYMQDNWKLPEVFLSDSRGYELEKLKHVCSAHEYPNYETWLNKLGDRDQNVNNDLIRKELLAYIAQNGLVCILHNIKLKLNNFNINDAVDACTGYTMLHLAALYGQLNMVEYLLHEDDAGVHSQCKNGFTPAHLAAIKGNKDCLQYLQYCMKTRHEAPKAEITCKLTVSKLLSDYEATVHNSKDFFVSDETALEVWSMPRATDKVRSLLKNLMVKNGTLNQSDFRKFVEKLTSEPKIMMHKVIDEMKDLLADMSNSNNQFAGKVITYRSNADGLNIPADSVHLFWEVTSTSLNKRKLRNEDFTESFNQGFYVAVKSTLVNFTFKSQIVWLSYPCIKKDTTGVTLFLALYEDDEKTPNLLKVRLIPVLKAEGHSEEDILYSAAATRWPDIKSQAFSTWKDEQEWTPIAATIEEKVYERLSKEQLLVLNGCRVLTKFLYSYWWFPSLENRRHNKIWHTYATSLPTLKPKVITSLFLEELKDSEDEDWVPEKFLDHIISIFKRGNMMISSDGKSYSRQDSLMSSNQDYFTLKAGFHVDGIVEFLEHIKKT